MENSEKTFEITITFPGDEWNIVKSRVHFSDREGERGGVSERSAEQQLLDFVRSQEGRYKLYGGKVSWRELREGDSSAK